MLGLWIFIGVCVLLTAWMIFREKTGNVIEQETGPMAPIGGGMGTVVSFNFMGESNPSAPDCSFACDNPLQIRAYSAKVDVFKKGDILYDGVGLGSPTNGNDNWIALTRNASVQVIKVDKNGKVTDICVC